MEHSLFIGESLRFGWRTMKKHFWFFAGLLLITMAVSTVPGIVLQALKIRAGIWVVISQIIVVVLSILIQVGLIKITLEFARGAARPGMGELYRSWRLFWKVLASAILYTLIVVCGFVLFIVPGVVWMLKFQFYCYLIVDKGLGPIAALKESARITRGAKWDLLGATIVFAIVNFLGVLALVFGIFATMPTVILALAHIYHKLSSKPA